MPNYGVIMRRLIRYALATLTLIVGLWLAVLTVWIVMTPYTDRSYLWPFIPLVLLAFADAYLMFFTRPEREGIGRLRRMWGLWLDAKEHELRSRVPSKEH